jgi:hypothetical protein
MRGTASRDCLASAAADPWLYGGAQALTEDSSPSAVVIHNSLADLPVIASADLRNLAVPVERRSARPQLIAEYPPGDWYGGSRADPTRPPPDAADAHARIRTAPRSRARGGLAKAP